MHDYSVLITCLCSSIFVVLCLCCDVWRWTVMLIWVLFCIIRFHIKRKSSFVVSWGCSAPSCDSNNRNKSPRPFVALHCNRRHKDLTNHRDGRTATPGPCPFRQGPSQELWVPASPAVVLGRPSYARNICLSSRDGSDKNVIEFA